MDPFSIITIVEGHGEVHAVPVLIRRIAEAYRPEVRLRVLPPIRRSRDRLVQDGELEKDIDLAAAKLDGTGVILVLIDSDGDCPATLGPDLLGRALRRRPDVRIEVVIAHREYEAWFLAAATSLRGARGLSLDLVPPPDPESISGAKEWLRKRMTSGRTYTEPLDQPALTAKFDLAAARTCPSFDKFCRVLEGLLDSAPKPSPD